MKYLVSILMVISSLIANESKGAETTEPQSSFEGYYVRLEWERADYITQFLQYDVVLKVEKSDKSSNAYSMTLIPADNDNERFNGEFGDIFKGKANSKDNFLGCFFSGNGKTYSLQIHFPSRDEIITLSENKRKRQHHLRIKGDLEGFTKPEDVDENEIVSVLTSLTTMLRTRYRMNVDETAVLSQLSNNLLLQPKKYDGYKFWYKIWLKLDDRTGRELTEGMQYAIGHTPNEGYMVNVDYWGVSMGGSLRNLLWNKKDDRKVFGQEYDDERPIQIESYMSHRDLPKSGNDSAVQIRKTIKPHKLKGKVFGQETGIIFKSKNKDIIFADIKDPRTGSPPASFKDYIEPEIIEKHFSGYENWKPVQYLPGDNTMMFFSGASNAKNDGRRVNFKFFRLNEGNTEETQLKVGDNDYLIFSSRFLGKTIKITPKKGGKETVRLIDLRKNEVLDEVSVSGNIPRLDPREAFPSTSLTFGGNMRNMMGLPPRRYITFDQLTWTVDDKIWFRAYSDDFYTKAEGRTISFGTVEEDGFKTVYSVTESGDNKDFFEVLSDYYNLVIKITDTGLLKTHDDYGSIYVFNLNSGGIRERKYGSLQIKNDMLSDEDKEYLKQFEF